jgi:hypothetical protein
MVSVIQTGFGKFAPFIAGGAMLLAAASPTAAAAQNGEKGDTVAEDVLDAVTQPLEDFNLRSKDIPQLLISAQSAPYDLGAVSNSDGTGNCQSIQQQVLLLEEVLGADADREPDKEGLANKGLQVGGSLLSGFIPFRGVVRQISGANAQRARMNTAIYAGIARRSYLKGYAQGLGCGTVDEIAVQSAEDLLGLSGR